MWPYWATAALLLCADALGGAGLPADTDRIAGHAEHAVAHGRHSSRPAGNVASDVW
ncbi:hypothetical protein ABZ924_25580 [Streptomyces sp. NPDC046876]|uniref:hypothetical protein n=1 Tax=Streptomyces sp. NPDC046876 TaxID=3155616 RepID=UPI0033EA8212